MKVYGYDNLVMRGGVSGKYAHKSDKGLFRRGGTRQAMKR